MNLKKCTKALGTGVSNSTWILKELTPLILSIAA